MAEWLAQLQKIFDGANSDASGAPASDVAGAPAQAPVADDSGGSTDPKSAQEPMIAEAEDEEAWNEEAEDTVPDLPVFSKPTRAPGLNVAAVQQHSLVVAPASTRRRFTTQLLSSVAGGLLSARMALGGGALGGLVSQRSMDGLSSAILRLSKPGGQPDPELIGGCKRLLALMGDLAKVEAAAKAGAIPAVAGCLRECLDKPQVLIHVVPLLINLSAGDDSEASRGRIDELIDQQVPIFLVDALQRHGALQGDPSAAPANEPAEGAAPKQAPLFAERTVWALWHIVRFVAMESDGERKRNATLPFMATARALMIGLRYGQLITSPLDTGKGSEIMSTKLFTAPQMYDALPRCLLQCIRGDGAEDGSGPRLSASGVSKACAVLSACVTPMRSKSVPLFPLLINTVVTEGLRLEDDKAHAPSAETAERLWRALTVLGEAIGDAQSGAAAMQADALAAISRCIGAYKTDLRVAEASCRTIRALCTHSTEAAAACVALDLHTALIEGINKCAFPAAQPARMLALREAVCEALAALGRPGVSGDVLDALVSASALQGAVSVLKDHRKVASAAGKACAVIAVVCDGDKEDAAVMRRRDAAALHAGAIQPIVWALKKHRTADVVDPGRAALVNVCHTNDLRLIAFEAGADPDWSPRLTAR